MKSALPTETCLKISGQFVTRTPETENEVCSTHLDMSEDQWPVCNQDGRNRRLCQSRPENSHGHTAVPQSPCTRQQLQMKQMVLLNKNLIVKT